MKFCGKWIDMLYNVATGSKQLRNILTPMGATFFFIVVGLFVVVSLQVDKLLELPKLFSAPLISATILCAGLFLMLWSILHFIKAKGTPVPFNPPPRLVTTGPYAYVRNPMLTGVFISLFGLGLLFRSISLVFIFTPLFILLNVLELRAIEEPELEKRLGNEYIEYKKRVPMFLPWIKARK
jgi:protein-S-isoprenylcysteine O-methyltransferase Ste14